MKRSLIVTASLGCLLAVLAVAQVVDWANVEWRFRGSSSLKFAPNVTLQDEDGNWSVSMTELSRLDGSTTHPTNYVLKAGDTMTGTLTVTGLTNSALTASKLVKTAADKSLTSSSYTDTDFFNVTLARKSGALINTVATNLVSITVPSGGSVGGVVNYTIFASNTGTNIVGAGILTYSGVALGTAVLATIEDNPVTAQANPTGAATLTWVWAADVATANKLILSLAPTTDLVATIATNAVSYLIMDNAGATIAAWTP